MPGVNAAPLGTLTWVRVGTACRSTNSGDRVLPGPAMRVSPDRRPTPKGNFGTVAWALVPSALTLLRAKSKLSQKTPPLARGARSDMPAAKPAPCRVSTWSPFVEAWAGSAGAPDTATLVMPSKRMVPAGDGSVVKVLVNGASGRPSLVVTPEVIVTVYGRS
jgi:hypothetical protein